MKKSVYVPIGLSVALTVAALAACHQDKPHEAQAPVDSNEGKIHPGALVGVWRLAEAPLDPNRSTCGKCEAAIKDLGTLRFAINEQGPPNVYGSAFSGQQLQRGQDGLQATADCAAPGTRESLMIASLPTGIAGSLARETSKDCTSPFQAQCACVYTLRGEKISDVADAPPPNAVPNAPAPKKT